MATRRDYDIMCGAVNRNSSAMAVILTAVTHVLIWCGL